MLPLHFSSAFKALGGDTTAVFDEWSSLSRMIIRDDTLRALPFEELYSRTLLHFRYQHFNSLLLMALTLASAMDSQRWRIVVRCGCCLFSNEKPLPAKGRC